MAESRENSTTNHFHSTQGLALAIIATPGILGNIFALVLTVKILRNQKIVCNVLVFGLILCDLLGIILMCSPTWAGYAFGKWTGGQPLCDFQGFFTVFSTLASGLIVTFMAIDRYLALKAPFIHRQHISFRLAKKVVAGIILFSAVISMLPLLGFGSFSFSSTGTYCTIAARKANDKIYAYFLAAIGFLLIIIVTFSNLNVLYWILKRKKSARNLKGMKSKFKKVNETKKTAAEKIQEQYQRMMIVISILFLVCWTPFLLRVICNTAGVWKSWSADRLATQLLLVNFVVDPFIYLLVRKQYRRTFFRICCWCFPCIKKQRRQSIKVRFAYSASLKNSDTPTVTEQIQENKLQTLRPREERCSIPKVPPPSPVPTVSHDRAPSTATDALVHSDIQGVSNASSLHDEIIDEEPPIEETKEVVDPKPDPNDNADLVAIETAPQEDTPAGHRGTLRDKQGILPTITEEDVRDALRCLAQDPGFANEGMTDDVDSVQFIEIMETLKDCFSGQRSRSNTRKNTGDSSEPGFDDNDLLISIEGDKNAVFVDASKADQAVGVKALQVMDVIQTKRRAKQIEKMV